MDWEDILKVRDKSEEKLQEAIALQRRKAPTLISQKRIKDKLEPRFKEFKRIEEGLETLITPKNPFPTPSFTETQKKQTAIRTIEDTELKVLNRKSSWRVNNKVKIIFERNLENMQTSKYDVRDLLNASLFLKMLSKINLKLPPRTMGTGKLTASTRRRLNVNPFTSLKSVNKYLKDIDRAIKDIEEKIFKEREFELLTQFMEAQDSDTEADKLKIIKKNLEVLKETIETLSKEMIPALNDKKKEIEKLSNQIKQEENKNKKETLKTKKEEASKSYSAFWNKTINIIDKTIDSLESTFGSDYFNSIMTTIKTAPSTTIDTFFPDSKKNKQSRLLNMLSTETYVTEVGKNNTYIMKEKDLKNLIEKLNNIRFERNQNFAFLQPNYKKRKEGKEFYTTTESNPQYNTLFKTPNKALETTLDILTILGGKYFEKNKKSLNKDERKKYKKTVSNNRIIRRLLDDWSDKSLDIVKTRVRAVEQIGLLESKNVLRINKILFQGEKDNFFVKDEHPFIDYDSGVRGKLNPTWDEDKNSWGTLDSDGEWDDRIILYDNKI